MEETPNLLSNIRFKETKKGYDPEQVDNFMLKLGEQVGELREMLRQAAQRAEVAEAQVSDAAKAKAAAEAAVEQAKADTAKAKEEAAAAIAAAAAQPASPTNEIEAASGMLAMAQKTADAAVEEAEAKAKEIVAEGRSRAAVMVIEAEQEIDRIKNRASQQIDKLAGERTAEVDAEVLRLKGERDLLKIDVDQLRSYVDEHRSKLRLGVEALERIINEEGALDMADAPDVSASEGLGTPSSTASATGDGAASDGGTPTAEPDAAPSDASAALAAPVVPVTEERAANDADDTLTTAAPDAVAPVVMPAVPSTTADTTSTDTSSTDTSGDETSGDETSGTGGTDAETADEAPAGDEEASPGIPIVTLEDLGTRTRAEDPAAAVKVAALVEGPEPDLATVHPPAAEPVAPNVAAPAAPEPAPAATPAASPVVAPVVTPVVIATDTVDGPSAGSAVAASAPATKSTIDLTGEHTLFPEGEPTQLFDVLGDDSPSPGVVLTRNDAPATTPLVNRELPLPTPGKAQVDSSLGTPDAEADEAMRAFFEQDAASAKETKSGRFLRRK